MNRQDERVLVLYLVAAVALSGFASVSFVGVGTVAAAGNTEGTLAGGVANQPTATDANPAVGNMPAAVVDQDTDADVTVGWDYSKLSGSVGTGPTELHVYQGDFAGGSPMVTQDIGSYSGTATLTIPTSSVTLASQQNVTLALYNPNVGGEILTQDTATHEVRSVGSAPAIDMRDFETRGSGNTDIQVGYNMKGSITAGDTLVIEATWPDGGTATTADLSGDPKGAATFTVPANPGQGSATFELHKNGIDGTPEATVTAKHTLETYISSQRIEYVNGTQPTISNIGIESRTMSFGGQGGFFHFNLVDVTRDTYGRHGLSGPNVGADESTLLWVNFTVENYSPEILQGPGDVETWQFSQSGSTADIDILVHPTSVYRYSGATGFDPNNWKSAYDGADFGFDASIALSVADIPGSFGSDLQGARLNTDAQWYNPPNFKDGTLQIDVAAPHCKDTASPPCSGDDVNDDGFYTAVVPKSFWSNNWRGDLQPDDLAGTYTSDGTTEDLSNMEVSTRSDDAMVINVTNIHYSSGTIQIEEDSTDPTADAGADVAVATGETVSFDGTASSDNNQISTFEWDVDDDGTYELTGSQPSHSYATAGDHVVTLRVTDGNGNQATDTVTVSVAASSGGGANSAPPVTTDGPSTSTPTTTDAGTPESTATPTPADTGTPTDAETDTQSGTDESSPGAAPTAGSSGPGFGAVGAVLAVLGAVASLARRGS